MYEKDLSHKKWMKRAIFLASLGKGKTSPNPLVGAVILDKNIYDTEHTSFDTVVAIDHQVNILDDFDVI